MANFFKSVSTSTESEREDLRNPSSVIESQEFIIEDAYVDIRQEIQFENNIDIFTNEFGSRFYVEFVNPNESIVLKVIYRTVDGTDQENIMAVKGGRFLSTDVDLDFGFTVEIVPNSPGKEAKVSMIAVGGE